jgi:hypothetical protein
VTITTDNTTDSITNIFPKTDTDRSNIPHRGKLSIADFMVNLAKSIEPDRFINWKDVLEKAGFYPVRMASTGNWPESHKWAKNMVGREHYTWTGNNFFFEDEDVATMFALCYGYGS